MSASEPDAKAPDVAGDAYEVGDDAGFAAAKAAIETSDAAEAIIEFTADNVNVGGFAGVAGKRVTLRSAEGQKFTLAGMGTDLVGDLTLDNVRCWGVNTKVFANGHRFETTEGFEGTGGKAIASLYGGGSQGNDVADGTSLILRGGSFSFVHGGGFDSDVAGGASVTIDGASAHVGSLFGGGHASATDRGRVGGDVEVAVLRGTNGMLFGGGQNEWSADSREPAAVSGGVHVSIGYEGAPAGSVRTGTAMYTYGGSWHSTVGSVLLELLEGSTNASTSGDRNYFGCGYRDTVRGTVKVVVDGSDLNEDGHVYGGGNEDSGNMDDAYGPVRILNEGGEPHALEMSYRSSSDNVDGGMNAGSNGEIPTEIGGDVLLRMEDGNIAFAILDNERFGHCTIDGDATIEVGGGRIAQIQGNKNHGSGDAFGSRLVYDGCGSADAPQESGYLYLFRDVQLVNGANVLIDSERFSQFDSIQTPIYSKPDLSINGASVLTTRDSVTSVLNVSVDDGTWHALGRVYVYEGVTSRDGHYFWDKYYAVGYNHSGDDDPSGFDAYRGERDEFVGSKEGTFVSRFYGNVVLDGCDVAFMGPVSVSGGFSGGDSLMRLPVTTDDNYTGGADSPSIPVNIDGVATGSCSVLAVDASDRLVPAAPALGDNYVTGWKADGASDEAFVLANDEDATVAGGLYLKRVEDPAAADGSYYMWQIAAKRTVTFDENGGDTKADPPVCDIPLVAGQTEYHATLPATEPTRVGYDFAGWSAEVDDPALAHEFTAASQVDRSMTVYAQWKARSDTAFRVEHYQVSVDGASARLVRAEDNVGATGAEAVARPISIPGCTYRPAFDQNGMVTASSGTIAADGSLVLRLYYTPDADALSYDANGGAGSMPPAEGVVGQEVAVAESAFSKQGYVFAGWNTKTDGSGRAYAPGDVYVLTAGEDKVFAQWEEGVAAYRVEHYKVSADHAQASRFSVDEDEGVTGSSASATARNVPGYTYQPLFDENGMRTVSSGTVAADGSLVLRLYYTPDADALSYDANGGTGATRATEGVVDQEVIVAESAFEKPGYGFTGWNTQADGAGAPYAAGEAYLLTVGEDRLFAQWTALDGTPYGVEHYKVAPDGASASLAYRDRKTGVTDAAAKAVPMDFSRDGYTYAPGFAGDGMVEVVEGTIAADGSLVLRLYYTPDADALSYDANGGAGSMPPAEGVVGQEVAVAESAFIRDGFSFAGWNTAPDGSGAAYAPGDGFALSAGEDRLFAQWVVDAVVDPEDFVLYVGGAHPDEGGSGAFPRALLSVALADGSEMDAVRWYVNGELFEPTEAAPHPFAIEYYDEDGNKVSGKPGDDAPGDYAVRIANAGDVQAEGGDGVRHAVRAEEGRYRVRDATEAKKVHASVGSESEVDGTEAAVLIPEGSTILVNGRPELGGPTEGGVSLLFDDLLTQERADRLSAKADATTSFEDPSGMQLKYLDLVDALNGNVWLSSSEGCTVFWPYPEGTDEHDEFELVHFPGLNREDLDDGLMDAVVPELVRIEKTPVGLKFHVPEGRFSPFALVWQKAAAEPDPPVEPESPVSPDPDLPIGSEPEAPKDLPASEAFPTPKALVKTGDGFPAAVAVVAGVALLAAALAGLRMRRDRRER